jgi:hypothetical protein
VRATARSMRAMLRQYILSTYGREAVQVFEDFGIPVPKTAGRTAKSKAQAVDKGNATREAKKAALEKVQPGGQPVQQQSTTPQK